jgi:hypothetical protein
MRQWLNAGGDRKDFDQAQLAMRHAARSESQLKRAVWLFGAAFLPLAFFGAMR